MTFYSVAVFYIAVFSVHLSQSEVSPPLPTLEFSSSVNQSNIALLSAVVLHCTIPKDAPFPVSVYLSQADKPFPTLEPLLKFEILRTPDYIIFTITASPELEGPLMCYYTSIKSPVTSGFSKTVNLVVSSLPDPIMTLEPAVFPMGVKYFATCVLPQGDFKNVTLSLFDRSLSMKPGNKSFDYIGSRALSSGEWGASVTRTSSENALEYMCEMEVFFNGKIMRSKSKSVAATIEELPISLQSKTHSSGSCIGNLLVRVSDNWRPICFPSSRDNDSTVADVVCRELGCGNAFDWFRISDISSNLVGTPNCTGNEKKLAECPMVNQKSCVKETLHVTCSALITPPKLSVSESNAASYVYVRTEEPVTIICSFESPSLPTDNDRLDLIFTYQGSEIYNSFIKSGESVTQYLRAPVNQGEYTCYIRAKTYNRRIKSNSLGIYIYNPPPVGSVVAAVITTVAGVAILLFVCVCRRDQPVIAPVGPGNTQDPEAPQFSNTTILPQGEPNDTPTNPTQGGL